MKEHQTTRELHTERKKMWDASMSNHVKYLDVDRGSFKEQFLEYRPCPVCRTDETAPLFRKSGGNYHRCAKCRVVFLNPVFKDEFLHEYYGTNHDLQSSIVENDSEFYLDLYRKGLSAIRSSASAPGRIVDIGCSSGVFLDLARAEGWETAGIELNRKEAEYCAKKGHRVFSEPIESCRALEQVNAVTMWDVFEHIKDGVSLLKFLHGRLAPEGTVFLQVPNCDSLAARVMHQKCNMYDGLEHVNLYSIHALQLVARECRYEVVGWSTVISEIGVLNNYMNYEDPYLGGTTEKKVLCGLVDEAAVLSAGLGYKIQMLLRRSSK